MDETLDLLTLALLPDVGPRCVRDLAARAPLADVLARPDDHGDLLVPAARSPVKTGAARRAAEAEMAAAARLGARIVGWDDVHYPKRLRQVYDPPPVLYVKGVLVEDDGESAVAIVGSRSATPEGRLLARAMARDLASWGATIVSGLARGIDTAAHKGALDAGGRTVAVLGSGIDRVYPGENVALAAAITSGGALVSEFRLGMEPYRGNFPRRNRTIAGWCRAVVVVEAAARSGALVTARLALDEGRDVMAVPGHPSVAVAGGTNALIRDGARLVRDAADVADEIGVVRPVTAREAAPADDVLGALRPDAPSSLEEIEQRSGKPVAELLARLSELELAAKVRRLPGALYVRS